MVSDSASGGWMWYVYDNMAMSHIGILTWCVAAEIIGYIGRILNAKEDPGCWTMGPYIMQNVLILIAPALMAASIYMILGRIILLTEGEHHALVRRRWLTKIFVFGDVASLLLQSSGTSTSLES